MQADKSLKQQRGTGMLGVLFIAAMFVFCVLFALKLIPVGMEYYTIHTTLQNIAHNPELKTDAERRHAFNQQAQIDTITSVTASDLMISDDEISVRYEKAIPLFEHATLLLSLDVSSASEQ
jgi:Domain of unknown function (DUF4845)